MEWLALSDIPFAMWRNFIWQIFGNYQRAVDETLYESPKSNRNKAYQKNNVQNPKATQKRKLRQFF